MANNLIRVFPRGEKVKTVEQYAHRICRKFGLEITSMYRTPEHNAAIGGAPNSYHTKGLAVDFVPLKYGFWGRLDRAKAWAWAKFNRRFVEVLWQAPGHYDHLHLAFKPGKAKPSKVEY